MGILQGLIMKKRIFLSFITLVISLTLSLPPISRALTADNPDREYDEFSGATVISDPNYSTGVYIENNKTPQSLLGFSHLLEKGLDLHQVTIIQNILQKKYSKAEFIAIEKDNIILDKDTHTIKTRVQLDRKPDQTHTLKIVFNETSENGIILKIYKGEVVTFIYVNGLHNTKRQEFHIRQKDTTSTDLIISATNREAAVTYITSLGYKVPDFHVSFLHYRNPFQ